MIESIAIATCATYGTTPETLSELNKINYIFGSNGTGKTTISRIIADESKFPTCRVTWKGGNKLQTMVYHRDFVESNFDQSTEFKGVFTLGEKHVDAIQKIAAAKSELDEINNKIRAHTLELEGADGAGGKKAELALQNSSFREICWVRKGKHEPKFQVAFEGYRNSKDNFQSKILQESASNSATLFPLEELEKKAETVFGSTPTHEPSVPTVDTAKLIAHEASSILRKRIIGKEDVDIAAMINRLGNSDWVQEGRKYYLVNDNHCPFCQRATPENFAQSINDYFDESFTNDTNAINNLLDNYITDSGRTRQQIDLLIANPSRFLDIEKLKKEKELFDSRIAINTQLLTDKKKEPSRIINLESIGIVGDDIKTLIDNANQQVNSHNRMVSNLSQERGALTAQVWKYLIETDLKDELTRFNAAQASTKKAIAELTDQIRQLNNERAAKITEIRELEKQTTSIQPTINAINSLLSSFGFKGFCLAKSDSGTAYKLVRKDGSDAKTTLSEGEKTFITFLYFYHLLKGSNTESGITTDRIVVFDDPVSSLDSDILFIVGSLIQNLFNEVKKGNGRIKQLFVLTHNVYFHKEVTFKPYRSKDGSRTKNETFWIVRKVNGNSRIKSHKTNPVRSSYELLWSELTKEGRSNLTIQNTLRRILENYFKIFGQIDFKEISAKFEGGEKQICKSLFSWVNDGSHYVTDDLYKSIDDSDVDNYLKVFRDIFDKSGHIAHYKMMMGENEPADIDQSPPQPQVEVAHA